MAMAPQRYYPSLPGRTEENKDSLSEVLVSWLTIEPSTLSVQNRWISASAKANLITFYNSQHNNMGISN
jgi:hypothetical protein